MPRNLATILLAAAALASPAPAASTAHFTLTSPADLAVVPEGASSVTLVFQIDWAGVTATYGDAAKVGLSITFPCCTVDNPLGGWIGQGSTSMTFSVADILQAMASHNTPPESAVQWTLHTHKGTALIENASSRFFVKPPHRPGPRLTPSVVPDAGSWPSKIVVTNEGDGRSDAAILSVKTTVAETLNPLVRTVCHPAFADFTRDVPGLEPGAKAEFSTLNLPIPKPFTGEPKSATSTAPQFRGPVKPTPATMPCTFELSVALGPGRGSRFGNATGVHGSLTRTINTMAPVN